MQTLLSERFAPITSSVGFLEQSLEEATAALERWRRSLYSAAAVTSLSEGFPAVLRRLEPLTGGARPRELLVRAGTRWTAYFDNSLRGTDAVSTIGHLTTVLSCQGLAVNVVPHTVGVPGVRAERMGAVQFELFGPLPTDFLNYVRTLSVSFDGKWQFDAAGTVQAFEEVDAYRARRVRDRFTSAMLERYCRALAIDVFNPDFYGPDAVLVGSALPVPPDGYVMTIEQAQEWLGIVPGMADRLPG